MPWHRVVYHSIVHYIIVYLGSAELEVELSESVVELLESDLPAVPFYNYYSIA